MPRLLRIIAFAIVGAIAGLGALQLYQFYQAAEQQHATYNYQPAQKPGFRIGAATKAPTPYYKPSCNNPNTREDADLCAQWAAVDQISETNRVTSLNLRLVVLTFIATIIGTTALIWTLIETRMVARRELRAYVNVDLAGVSDGTYHPDRGLPLGVVSGGWTIKNTGQTPAYNVRHWGEITIISVNQQDALVPPKPLIQVHGATLPKDGTNYKFLIVPKNPTKRDIKAIQKREMAVFVYGRIEYTDVFEENRFTEYRLHYFGVWPPPANNLLYFSERGNEAN